MKTIILTMSLMFGVSAFADEIVTIQNPLNSGSFVSKRSNFDGVCKSFGYAGYLKRSAKFVTHPESDYVNLGPASDGGPGREGWVTSDVETEASAIKINRNGDPVKMVSSAYLSELKCLK